MILTWYPKIKHHDAIWFFNPGLGLFFYEHKYRGSAPLPCIFLLLGLMQNTSYPDLTLIHHVYVLYWKFVYGDGQRKTSNPFRRQKLTCTYRALTGIWHFFDNYKTFLNITFSKNKAARNCSTRKYGIMQRKFNKSPKWKCFCLFLWVDWCVLQLVCLSCTRGINCSCLFVINRNIITMIKISLGINLRKLNNKNPLS